MAAVARRFDWGGATENAGFDAKVERNLGLDPVTKQHKSLQKLRPVYSLTRANFPNFVMRTLAAAG